MPHVQFTFNIHPKQFYLGGKADQMKEQKVRPRKHLCHKYTSVKKNRERNHNIYIYIHSWILEQGLNNSFDVNPRDCKFSMFIEV